MHSKPHSRRGGRALLIVLASILVVGLCGAIWLATRPKTQPGADEGRQVAELFLKTLGEGRPDLAWNSSTAEFKSAQGLESFVKEVKNEKYLTQPMQFVSMQVVMVQEQPRSEYLFRSPQGSEVRLVLGKENGAWKVDRWLAKR